MAKVRDRSDASAGREAGQQGLALCSGSRSRDQPAYGERGEDGLGLAILHHQPRVLPGTAAHSFQGGTLAVALARFTALTEVVCQAQGTEAD